HLLAKPMNQGDILRVIGQALQSPSPAGPLPPSEGFSQGHLRLLTNKIAGKVKELETANRRLALVVNLGRQIALEHDPLRLMDNYCQEARNVLGASYAAIGLLAEDGRRWDNFFFSGLNEEVS